MEVSTTENVYVFRCAQNAWIICFHPVKAKIRVNGADLWEQQLFNLGTI